MKTPHKHAALIHAWADGAEIETRHYLDAGWFPMEEPHWHLEREYRVKPETKPDVVETYKADTRQRVRLSEHWEKENLKLTFDGETGKLKAAEVIE